MMGLSPKQRTLLSLLDATMKTRGVCPSYAEMQKSLGVKSKGCVHRLIVEMERRGHIRRLRNKARAIEVIRPAPPPTAVARAEAKFLVEAGAAFSLQDVLQIGSITERVGPVLARLEREARPHVVKITVTVETKGGAHV